MKKNPSLYIFKIMALGILLTYVCSCTKKSDGEVNNVVLETPYAIYFSDSNGAIFKSNDGINESLIVTPDGVPCRALCTSGTNLLYVKKGPTGKVRAFYSLNNGINFNETYDTITTYPMLAVNGVQVDLNQSMIINCPAWAHIYLSSQSPQQTNDLGFVWSALNGIPESWYVEDYYDTVEITNITHNIRTTSFTELASTGVLVAYDGINNRLFYRNPPFSTANRWKESIKYFTPAASLGDTLIDNPLIGQGFYFLGHLNNRLIGVDALGLDSAKYSDDMGITWYAIKGLPANTPALSISAPFETVCLVGTYGKGIYMYNANTGVFQASNHGLPDNAIVWGITFKENFYKNSTNLQYIYLATNSGIYRSTDGGNNWIKTISGNFTDIY